MTRDEAVQNLDSYYIKTRKLITQIYDDFENQTCDNCKFWNKFNRCLEGVVPTSVIINGEPQEIADTFGCNKWEEKL